MSSKGYYESNRAAACLRAAVNAARTRSGAKGLPFNIDHEYVRALPEVLSGVCPLTQIPFVNGRGGAGPYSPSLDRIEPGLGYVQGNVRVVLHCVNDFKGLMTDEEMLVVARALVGEF